MNALIDSLLSAEVYDHPVENIELLETHISWVILTGPFAYKIKKPVNFGFLDFSTLAKRKHYCEEELRLNRRLAPQLYLDVVSINASEPHPEISGNGEVLDYAVKMQQFPSGCLLSDVLDRGDLREPYMDRLARVIAAFHEQTEIATAESKFGTQAAVQHPVIENFQQIRSHLQDEALLNQLAKIEVWCEQAANRLAPQFSKRKTHGFIRECHGDLHLGNIILLNEKLIPFDCIEFNENLRWIDVLSEIAFMIMDLDDYQRPDLARHFLNTYLEVTGDYNGLGVLQYYKVYRAMVRAKVNALRLAQEDLSAQQHKSIYEQCRNYIALGRQYIKKRYPVLIITHGFSGSGKTSLSHFMLEALPIIRIRTDIERKRLHQLAATEDSHSSINSGIYDSESSRVTYQRMLELARQILQAGMPVIVDGAFLKAHQRQPFVKLADELNIPFRIIDCQASHAILEQRIAERRQYGNDASEATRDVLLHQQETHDPLTEKEIALTYTIDSTEAMSYKNATAHVNALLHGHQTPDDFPDIIHQD